LYSYDCSSINAFYGTDTAPFECSSSRSSDGIGVGDDDDSLYTIINVVGDVQAIVNIQWAVNNTSDGGGYGDVGSIDSDSEILI
jgi:hypothetical protein